MNQRNFDYLSDQVKYTGFGEGLEKELKKQMEKQKPAFTLTHRGNLEATGLPLNYTLRNHLKAICISLIPIE